MHTGRHAALYSLGRLDEADEEYRTIERLCPTALERADATCGAGAQPDPPEPLRGGDRARPGVAARARHRRAGARTGSPPSSTASSTHLYRWLDDTDAADDLARPEITDPTLLAATRLIDAVLPAAYFVADHADDRLAEPGGAADLARARPGPYPARPGGHAAFAAVALRGDYAAGYRAMRRILALGEARGYEPDTSQARFLFALVGLAGSSRSRTASTRRSAPGRG